MSESKERESAVQKVRRVRDQLNREIENASGAELLDLVRRHQYVNPLLQRLASKAVSRAEASGAASGER